MSEKKLVGEPQEEENTYPETREQLLQREKERLQLLQRVATTANEADSVEEAFRITLDLVCNYTRWPLAHVFIPRVEADGSIVLASSGIWFCDDCEENETFTFFQEVTKETTFAPGEGWLGYVFTERVPTWSLNVLEEPDFLRNHRLRDLNVRAGFAFPVLIGNEVVAIMEFYATATMQPDEELLQLMRTIGTQLGRVVEREQAAQELRQREMLLTEAQAVARMGAWELDVETGSIKATDQVYEILGVEREKFELSQENLLSLLHPDDRETAVAQMETGFARKEPWDIYPRIVRPDGTLRHLHIRNRPMQVEQGVPQRVLGIIQDVTIQKEVEQSLKRSRSFLADAQRLAQVGNWEFNLETDDILFSNELYRIYGLDPEKDTITQKLLYEMEHPDDRNGTRQRIQDVQNSKQPYSSQFRVVLPTSEIRHMEAYTEPVLDADGKVYKLRGSVQDVTERKKAEDKILKQLEQLTFLQEMGQAVVSALDLDVVLERVLHTLRPLLNAEGVSVLLRQGEAELYFAAANHLGAGNLTNMRLSIDSGVAGMAVRTGEVQWLSGPAAREQVYTQIEEIAGYITRSIIAVPLQVKERIIGVVEAVHHEPDAFVQDDLIILQSAASWIATAVENARLYGAVEQAQQRYRELADELVWAQEEERRRISRDLHDDIGQRMVALEIQLELLQREAANKALQSKIEDIRELITDINQRLHILAYNLRPPELEVVGLRAALVDLCREYEKSHNVPIHFTGEELPQQVPDEIILTFYRFLQEALTNIFKHAAATQVEVKLTYNREFIRLYVADNGRGFDEPPHVLSPISGLGLLGMQERFAKLNGTIQISSVTGKGTELLASVPW